MIRRVAAFLLAAALWCILADGVQAQEINCRSTVVYDASTNGSTKLITGIAQGNVYICGFNIWAAGTATVKVVYGTGTNCATNQTAMTPAYSLVTQTGIADGSSVWRGLLAPAGVDVCIVTSAGVAVQAQIYYAQR
jgi:hypothetical protein